MKNPLDYIQEYPHRTKQILGITNDQFQDLLAQAEKHHNELQAEIELKKIATIQLRGIILLHFATFLFSAVTLLLVRFPDVKTTTARNARKTAFLQDAAYGWTHIIARPGLLGLLIFFAANNFPVEAITLLLTPLVLLTMNCQFICVYLQKAAVNSFLTSQIWQSLYCTLYPIRLSNYKLISLYLHCF